jgi:hypothetical protein
LYERFPLLIMHALKIIAPSSAEKNALLRQPTPIGTAVGRAAVTSTPNVLVEGMHYNAFACLPCSSNCQYGSDQAPTERKVSQHCVSFDIAMFQREQKRVRSFLSMVFTACLEPKQVAVRQDGCLHLGRPSLYTGGQRSAPSPCNL